MFIVAIRGTQFLADIANCYCTILQAAASSAAESLVDCHGSLLIIFSNSSAPVRLAAKYRPGVPLLVLTTAPRIAKACSMIHGAVTIVVDQKEKIHNKNELILLVSILCVVTLCQHTESDSSEAAASVRDAATYQSAVS